MKHTLAVAAFAAALLGVTAAGAATTTQPATTPNYAKPVIADADAMKAADALHHSNLSQQLQDQLTKAGYTNIKVTPSSFYIRATDKKGEPVAMVIGPDSFTEVSEVKVNTPGPTAQQNPPASTSKTVTK